MYSDGKEVANPTKLSAIGGLACLQRLGSIVGSLQPPGSICIRHCVGKAGRDVQMACDEWFISLARALACPIQAKVTKDGEEKRTERQNQRNCDLRAGVASRF